MNRRSFFRVLGGAIAAPAIVRISSLMPVSVMPAAEELESLALAGGYGMNHSLAVKVWAKKLFVEALKQTKFSQYQDFRVDLGFAHLTSVSLPLRA